MKEESSDVVVSCDVCCGGEGKVEEWFDTVPELAEEEIVHQRLSWGKGKSCTTRAVTSCGDQFRKIRLGNIDF